MMHPDHAAFGIRHRRPPEIRSPLLRGTLSVTLRASRAFDRNLDRLMAFAAVMILTLNITALANIFAKAGG